MLKLAWKNILHKPLNLLLNILLLSLGVGLISFLFLLNDQLKDKFDKNLAGIDLVIGAKGSPLQMILCSMYHIDNPTGNIKISEATPYLRPNHPLIKQAVPLSLGDSYSGFRIVGTEHNLVELYNGKIAKGKMFNNTLEATIGATVAKQAGLKIGDSFKSTHGFIQDEDMTHDHGSLTVVGILEGSGSVLDQLILCNTGTVWAMHDHEEGPTVINEEEESHEHNEEGHHHDHDHEGHDHSDHDHSGHHDHEDHNHGDHAGHDHEDHNHDHDHHHGHSHNHGHHEHGVSRADLLSHPDKEITSVLLQYKSKTNIHALNMPRTIRDNTEMMAASPAYEINRLYSMMGVGTKVLQSLAFLIAFVSAISIFISLLSSLRERAYELSLIRVMGAKPMQLFMLLIYEGLLLAFIGAVIGFIFSRIAMYFMVGYMGDNYNYEFATGLFNSNDWKILAVSLLIGFVAALIPAIQAYKTDIHKTLSVK